MKTDKEHNSICGGMKRDMTRQIKEWMKDAGKGEEEK